MTDTTASKARAVVLTILGNILVFMILAVAAAVMLAGVALVFGPAIMTLV